MNELSVKSNKTSAMVKQVFKYFMIGVFAIIPAIIIIQIVLFVKKLVTGSFVFFYGYTDSYLYTFLVFAVSFAVFTSIGYSTVKYGRSVVIAGFDRVIERIPLLNTIYRVSKKLITMLTGHEEVAPRGVVYVEYPKEGLWVPAYVTNKRDDMYILFVPTSPNPTSGFTIIVHESKVVKSEMDIEQATSFVVSIGVDYFKPDEVSKLKP